MTIHSVPPAQPKIDTSAGWAKIRQVEQDKRAQAFAAKWRADEHTEEPTDDALRAAFERCVLPPKPEAYPAIRAHITAS